MEKIIQIYKQLGINIPNDSHLNHLFFEIGNDTSIFKQIELAHMDFLLCLKEIEEKDKKSFDKYVCKLNGALKSNNINFWGEYIEIKWYGKLLKINSKYISNLKRGKDGVEADFIFEFNNIELGIELTSLKFKVAPKDFDEVYKKIIDKIIEKNKSKYSNNKTILLIDVSNLYFISEVYGLNLKNEFTNRFRGFSYTEHKIKFGFINLIITEFITENNTLRLYSNIRAILGLVDENGNTDRKLLKFVTKIFNDFKIPYKENDIISIHPFLK